LSGGEKAQKLPRIELQIGGDRELGALTMIEDKPYEIGEQRKLRELKNAD
jgi:hypothetical protein